MCPDKKLNWFDKNPDWRTEDRAEARRLVRERWEDSYSGDNPFADSAYGSAAGPSKPQPRKQVRSISNFSILLCASGSVKLVESS